MTDYLYKLQKLATKMWLEDRDHLRLGQAYYNALCELEDKYPELGGLKIARKITNTNCDPFYEDGRLTSFISKVSELLSKGAEDEND